MDEAEPPKQGEKEANAPPENVQARSQMTKPLAPIESGVEECDLCGRWKSKCRICAALFCEQCSMGEAIRLSHMRRGTVICGQCAVTLEHVPNARIIPISIPELPSGPALCTDKAWKQGILKTVTRIPSRPPPAVNSPAPRAPEKEFSADEMDNDFKYQNLFEVLFSPDLHLLSAMFEVLPEEESGDRLLAAILRLIDRSARTEPIMKACVEMEVRCRSPWPAFDGPSCLGSHQHTAMPHLTLGPHPWGLGVRGAGGLALRRWPTRSTRAPCSAATTCRSASSRRPPPPAPVPARSCPHREPASVETLRGPWPRVRPVTVKCGALAARAARRAPMHVSGAFFFHKRGASSPIPPTHPGFVRGLSETRGGAGRGADAPVQGGGGLPPGRPPRRPPALQRRDR